ncbi:MAG: sensor histidine kinase [Pseudonocardiaceae bacterium]|nr:sensor histidine kinase [Pseudonocardiaceae bacterium]
MRRWPGRSGPEGVDLYTRGSLYLLSGSEPLVALYLLREGPVTNGAAVATLAVTALVHAVACLALLRAGLAVYLGRRAFPRAVVLVAVGVSVLAGAGVLLLVPGGYRPGLEAPAVLGLHILLAYTLAAFTPLLTLWSLVAVALVAAAAFGLSDLLQAGDGRLAFESAVSAAFLWLVLLVVYRPSVWLVGVVWQLDDAQRTRARLAVAEERLRFARDLHDAVGGKLSAIAVKSELAAEFARRGKDTAAEQALEVRTIANEALADVREVVRGYRQVDLDAEIAGSRALLRAAGVQCRTIGEATELAPDVQAALGWVVRRARPTCCGTAMPRTARSRCGPDRSGSR